MRKLNRTDVSESGMRVLYFARYEASRHGSEVIKDTHLLLGLVREDRSLVKNFLGRRSVDALLSAIEYDMPKLEAVCPNWYCMDELTQQIIRRASLEFGLLEVKWMGPRHILLGIVATEDCSAAKILKKFGIDHGAVSSYVHRLPETYQEHPLEVPLLVKLNIKFRGLFLIEYMRRRIKGFFDFVQQKTNKIFRVVEKRLEAI